MSGGEECVQSEEVEVLAGDGRKMESLSTKRKTTEGTVCGGQLFAPLLEELANKKKTADGSAAAEEEKAAAAQKPPGPKARMPDREIRRILSRKPVPAPPEFEALKQTNPDLAPLPGEEMDDKKEDLFFRAKVYYCMEERFPKLQEWVRQELATKGYVEMDDDWVRRRAEAAEAFEEGRKEIEKRVKELGFSEDEMDFLLDSDSDDDEEEESCNDHGDNNDGEEEEGIHHGNGDDQ
ncbi:unnamed protein product [Urochloa humidicola]